MKINGRTYRTIWPDDDGQSIHVIDQIKLPHVFETRRLASSEAKGFVRAKTGSMTGVRAWVGVADRASDAAHPKLVFALMLSNLTDASLAPGETFDQAADALVLAPIR